jgi:oligoribonuclease (3'-5' exoribonuclease)
MGKRSKWDWTMSRVAWIDVETDGLVRPGKPMPLCLEVALILTDGDLRELGRYSAVIEHPAAVLDALNPHPVVAEMHGASGLWNALREPGVVAIADAEAAMIELLEKHCAEEPGVRQGPGGVDTRPVVWGGFSPAAVDRPVLAAYMPTFYQRIHHRSVDVSALKLAMRNWAGIEIPKIEAIHRAVPDTEQSIGLAQAYRRFLNLSSADRIRTEVRSLEVRTPAPPPAPVASVI